MSTRNDSASILTVGCLLTNALIAPAETSMITIATMTAATITNSSSTMPTAVITESSEKTTSSTRIWAMTAPNETALPDLACSSPSRCSWIS